MARQSKNDPNKYADRKPYNGLPVSSGEVLAPIWLTDEIMQTGGDSIIRENLTTWKFCECHFRIGFISVKAETFDSYMSEYFWPELNAEIEKNCPGRCVIGTKPNGSPKLCPKANLCTGCDNYGKLPRYNPKKETVINECVYFFDDQEHDLIDTIHPEPGAAIMEEATKDELIEHLNTKDQRYGKIVELRLEGYELSKIFEVLGLKQSQGYNIFRKAKAETKKFWHL